MTRRAVTGASKSFRRFSEVEGICVLEETRSILLDALKVQTEVPSDVDELGDGQLSDLASGAQQLLTVGNEPRVRCNLSDERFPKKIPRPNFSALLRGHWELQRRSMLNLFCFEGVTRMKFSPRATCVLRVDVLVKGHQVNAQQRRDAQQVGLRDLPDLRVRREVPGLGRQKVGVGVDLGQQAQPRFHVRRLASVAGLLPRRLPRVGVSQ
mmetsp:Transcript_6217/g.10709  ORF Transcript_6217/g.10709 Transcript_6217/m.10709 type:complete len:210 (+) Transcript_6217:678-1307(+)